jgi:hypothetical protein
MVEERQNAVIDDTPPLVLAVCVLYESMDECTILAVCSPLYCIVIIERGSTVW